MYSENGTQMTHRRLCEFSTVMFIFGYTSCFCAIRQIVTCCSELFERVCGQCVFTGEHKW